MEGRREGWEGGLGERVGREGGGETEGPREVRRE